MTEKFMKLSEFLKLIKKEDEPETLSGTDEQSVPDRVADLSEGSIETPPELTPPNQAIKKTDSDKMPVEELLQILRDYGWKARVGVAPAAKRRVRPSAGDNKNPEDIKELIGGLNSALINELFTPDELKQLTEDETHVFTDDDLKSLSANKPKTPDEGETGLGITRALRERKRKNEKEKAAAEGTQTDEKISVKQEKLPKQTPPLLEIDLFEDEERSKKRIRRARHKKTGCLGGLMYFSFVVCLSAVLASVGWLAANDVLSLNKSIVSATVTVDETVNIETIASQLEEGGIIEYKSLFKLFARFSKAQEKIEPGIYELNSGLDYRAIVAGMKHYAGWVSGERDTIMVMIPEGKTANETFEILEKAAVCSTEELRECAANYVFDYDFLSPDSLGNDKRLEGYLFPDTYEFYIGSLPEEVIVKFLDNFKVKVTDEMYAQAEAMGRSMHDIITIASLIEMEAGADSERSVIASVIYNRLESNYYPYLQIDASVIYALEERKEAISYEDRLIDSPYNTFLYEGLPPGAISNPGLASIRAALDPMETGYYFYALGKSGTHEFFSDYNQFQSFLNSEDFGG